MIINGNSYRYEVVKVAGMREYLLVDHNTDLVLAQGLKKEITIAAKLLCLRGTVALAGALGEYAERENK